ncbi:Pre-mRNA-splicing factor CWC21 [Fusarium oxysporum f. sp. albedinis]|nr:Pre-mRNA-splicing factor CWC21 [Fusarium oxysporum f. sp. albedinis]
MFSPSTVLMLSPPQLLSAPIKTGHVSPSTPWPAIALPATRCDQPSEKQWLIVADSLEKKIGQGPLEPSSCSWNTWLSSDGEIIVINTVIRCWSRKAHGVSGCSLARNKRRSVAL